MIQHLTLDESEYFHKDWDYAARRVMSPPFRDKAHQDSLWAGLAAGSLQVVATDHAAFTTAQKRMGLKGFPSIPNGTGGLEERLAVLWTEGVDTGRLTPNEFVAVTSTNIAKILNVYPRKGAIVEGADADIVVWDPKPGRRSRRARRSRSSTTTSSRAFEVTAQARYTLSRGDVVWADGRNSQPQPGRGRFVAAAGVLGAAPGAGGVEGAERAAADRARSDEHPVRGLRRGVRRRRGGRVRRRGRRTRRPTARASAAVPVPAARSYAEALARLRRAAAGGAGWPPAAVVEELAAKAEGGLLGMTSPNFHGWVVGASHPAGVAADWLTSAWGQAGGFADPTPAAAAAEEVAAGWVLDLLGPAGRGGRRLLHRGDDGELHRRSPSARDELLRRAGWDVEARGLFGAPEVHVVLGGEAHSSILLSLRLLGFGAERVHVAAADEQGRMRPDALAAVLAGLEGPMVVCLQAGNVVSGAFDPFAELIPLARAQGRLGACRRRLRALGAGGAGAGGADRRGWRGADSWAADGHKWLQVPYDCGLAIVRDAAAQQRAMSITASYLPRARTGCPTRFSPEMSRRSRGFAVWAVLKALGREGVAEMVERHCAVARRDRRAAGGGAGARRC